MFWRGIFFRAGGELDDEMQKVLRIVSEKLDYYFNRRWEENNQGFERVLEKSEDALPSLTYLEHCISF